MALKLLKWNVIKVIKRLNLLSTNMIIGGQYDNNKTLVQQ